MAYINTPSGLPGIVGLMMLKAGLPDSINGMAHQVFFKDSLLSRADREMIASYISYLNKCYFCQYSHGCTAAVLLGNDFKLLETVYVDYTKADISPKQKALLEFAAKVNENSSQISQSDINLLLETGISESEIHDTAMIASFIGFANNYIISLGADVPAGFDFHLPKSKLTAEKGYLR